MNGALPLIERGVQMKKRGKRLPRFPGMQNWDYYIRQSSAQGLTSQTDERLMREC